MPCVLWRRKRNIRLFPNNNIFLCKGFNSWYFKVLHCIVWYIVFGFALLALEQDAYLLLRPSLRQDVESEACLGLTQTDGCPLDTCLHWTRLWKEVTEEMQFISHNTTTRDWCWGWKAVTGTQWTIADIKQRSQTSLSVHWTQLKTWSRTLHPNSSEFHFMMTLKIHDFLFGIIPLQKKVATKVLGRISIPF